jgi:hypothetical protein
MFSHATKTNRTNPYYQTAQVCFGFSQLNALLNSSKFITGTRTLKEMKRIPTKKPKI